MASPARSGARAHEELDELSSRLEGVEGWLSDEEAETLFVLAKRCSGRGSIVEIGSHQGRSTICLGMGALAGHSPRIHAIDPRSGKLLDAYRRNIAGAGVEGVVTTHCMTSAQAAAEIPADEPVELLFIDGSHRYEMVALDFDLWVPRLIEGGYLAMHDTIGFGGSRRIADERVYRGDGFADVRFVPSTLTVARKVRRASARDRLRARRALAVKRLAESMLRIRRHLPPRAVQAGRRLLRRLA
jgi:predicted O-methyltransferase YrrM